MPGRVIATILPTSSPEAMKMAEKLMKQAGSSPGDSSVLSSMELGSDGAKTCYVNGNVFRLKGEGKILITDPSSTLDCNIARGILKSQESYLAGSKSKNAKIPKKFVPAALAFLRDKLIKDGPETETTVKKAHAKLSDKFKKGMIGDSSLNELNAKFEEEFLSTQGGRRGHSTIHLGDDGEDELGDVFEKKF